MAPTAKPPANRKLGVNQSPRPINAAKAAKVAVLYIHALNPYGFSWWRRTTHENVDLNRNFRDFGAPLPRNEAYDEIADLLVPQAWPPDAATAQATACPSLSVAANPVAPRSRGRCHTSDPRGSCCSPS